MAVTIEQFAQRLVESGLVSAEELAAVQTSLPPGKRPQTTEDLAKVLVQQGKLTKYQAQAVYQGKTKGLVFGEYVVLDKLGQGGMGVVLKARHQKMDRLVAVKVLPAATMKSPQAVERFYREVKAAAKLSHPNIVTAHDAGEHEGMHYLVMEYVEGKDLAVVVEEHGTLPVQQAIDCTLQAAKGLEYAHKRGVVHRDIKPANLLLDKEGTVKVLDMGLARLTANLGDDPAAKALTGTGQIMGTVDYMAPEQAVDIRQADHRADIYALGCTLYRLLTGKPVFEGETIMQTLLAHREQPIPRIGDTRPDVPPELDSVFQKMVAKQTEDRYQSMGQVVAELQACVAAAEPAVQAARGESSSDSSLGALIRSITQPVVPRRTSTPAVAETCAYHAERDTGTGVGKRVLAIVRGRKGLLLAVGGGVAGLVLLLGIILVLTLRHGTMVVEIDEKLGKDVQVAVTQGGEKVQLVDAKSGWTLSLSAGKYEVAVEGGDDQFQLDSQSITVTRGGQVKVRVTLKPPPLAVAPFDDKKAKEHQATWAKHLGVPVETTNSIGMKLVLIPPGEFMMGSPKELIEEELKTADGSYKDILPGEGPQHRVRITKPFYMGVREVTQGEYEKVMGKNPSEFCATGKGKDKIAGQDTKRFPVECVSWDEATEFCVRLSNVPEEKAARRRYVLPSEAQWECACRSGSQAKRHFGDEEARLRLYGWYNGNAGGNTHRVDQLEANPFGLYDMYGNVFEWCLDWYDKEYYAKSATDDPAGPAFGSYRVLRGGNWEGPARQSRSAARFYADARDRDRHFGLRVLQVLADTAAERAKMSRTTETAQPSGGSTANKPPPAVAPFDAAKAREHQQQWAKHLGVPVEVTNSIGMKLVLIPPGEFMMGSPKELIEEELKAYGDDPWYKYRLPGEGPQHRVRITKPFYLGVTEVTQEEYQRVVGTNPNGFSATGTGKDSVGGQDTRQFPVEQVSWDDAVEFCRKLSNLPEEKTAGRTYRLPSEAQWEYACRAGSTGRFSFSSGRNGIPKASEEQELSDYGWFLGNAGGRTHVVGGKRASAWGLYDMHGNVWEWCQDWHDEGFYAKSATYDPAGPPGGLDRVNRGGRWDVPARRCRSAYRGSQKPRGRDTGLGLRVSLILVDKQDE